MRRLTVNLLYKMINIIYRGNFNGPDRRSPVGSETDVLAYAQFTWTSAVGSAQQEDVKGN